MTFLVDQDVYALTIRLLRNQGHDVVTAEPIPAPISAGAVLPMG
jgi:hypothetical protein